MSQSTNGADDQAYHLLSYDTQGVERPVEGTSRSEKVVQLMASRPITDVVLMSHGWQGDVPAARRQYDAWVAAMGAPSLGRATMEKRVSGLDVLVVGLHWPSKAWGDEDLGDGSFGAVADTASMAPVTVESLAREHAERLGAGSPEALASLETILRSALDDMTPETMPADVVAAYARLDQEVGLDNTGEAGEPGGDREVFDAAEIYDEILEDEWSVGFGGVSSGGLLAPLRVLTFWQMKRRACRFGESGANELLRRLKEAVPAGRPVRFHLAGHSFGCIVVSAAVAGRSGSEVNIVDSLVLIQGAMSLWSFCSSIPSRPDQPGYFHRLSGDNLVRGPRIVTTSEFDRAVGFFYPLGARARRQVAYAPNELPKYGALGTFGSRGPVGAVETEALHSIDAKYAFEPSTFYNLESSGIIREGGGASGAHSDICHPEVAHAVWSAMAATT